MCCDRRGSAGMYAIAFAAIIILGLGFVFLQKVHPNIPGKNALEESASIIQTKWRDFAWGSGTSSGNLVLSVDPKTHRVTAKASPRSSISKKKTKSAKASDAAIDLAVADAPALLATSSASSTPPQQPKTKPKAESAKKTVSTRSSSQTAQLTNSCLFSGQNTAERNVIINEIAWMGSSRSSSDEFVELYNAGDAPADLTEWKITRITSLSGTESPFVSTSTFLGKTIAPHGYILLANVSSSFANIAIRCLKGNTLANTPEHINGLLLYDNANTKIDEVIWTSIPVDQSYERISWDSPDFQLETAPNPQNSLSSI